MLNTILDLIRRIFWDVFRLFLILLLVYFLNLVDNRLNLSEKSSFLFATISSTSLVFLIAGLSHVIRRILFPRIDLQKFARKAYSDSLSASIVFLGICILLSTFIVVNVMLLS